MKKTIALGLVMVWAAAGLASASSPVITLNFNDADGASSLANSGTAGGTWKQGASGSRIDTAHSPNNTTGFVGYACGGNAFSVAAATYKFPIVQSFTIGGWICRTGALSAANANIFGNAGTLAGFSMNVISNGTYRLCVEPGTGQIGLAPANGKNKLELGTWTFVAMTYDGTASSGNVTYYSATSTNALTVGSTVTLNQGDVASGTSALSLGGGKINYAPGLYDDMRIYISETDATGALSQSEITEWMKNSDVGSGSAPGKPIL